MSSPVPNAKSTLVDDGWRKRSGDFYTRRLAPRVDGLLALAANRGLPHQWRLQPYVGVVHERVNALARTLTGATTRNPYPQDTIRTRLVTLLDGAGAQERDRWLVAAESHDRNAQVFAEVARAAREVGLPWMEARTSLDAVIYELEDGNGPVRLTPLLTAALWLTGNVEAAERRLVDVATRFGEQAPPPPQQLPGVRVTAIGSSAPPEGWPRPAFDAFAARLRAGMEQYPDGPPEDWRSA
ncbi:hypothetical protein [Nocardioides marmorisolisilvae]|uniref:hypothetical protein n=1 Tax=Nocardioides marmorisolisilvae TaxID=1542737 RepID=UPI0011CD4102|nr:hypothetical protein [Nocardioides marmorisolisilvae]